MDADSLLARRLAADLDDAFPTLVTDHTDRLYTITLRLLGDSRDAEEVAQDALVRAYRAIASYPGERTAELKLRPWLASIAVNLARNRRRRHDDRHPPDALEGSALSELESRGAERLDPSHAVVRRESKDELAALLMELSPAIRAAVVLRHVDGLSVAETAEALGRPEGTVKAQVARGLERLRVLMTTGAAAEAAARIRPAPNPRSRPIMPGRSLAAAEVLS